MKMFYQPSVKEKRAILTLAKIIGENEIPNLGKSRYFSVQGLHVYSHNLEPRQTVTSLFRSGQITKTIPIQNVFMQATKLNGFGLYEKLFGSISWQDS